MPSAVKLELAFRRCDSILPVEETEVPEWRATLYVLTDVLPVLSILSKTFQEGNVNFSQIAPSIIRTVASLEAILEQNKALLNLKNDLADGGRLHFLFEDIRVTDATIKKMQEKNIKSVIENINNRFDSNILPVLSVLDYYFQSCFSTKL